MFYDRSCMFAGEPGPANLSPRTYPSIDSTAFHALTPALITPLEHSVQVGLYISTVHFSFAFSLRTYGVELFKFNALPASFLDYIIFSLTLVEILMMSFAFK